VPAARKASRYFRSVICLRSTRPRSQIATIYAMQSLSTPLSPIDAEAPGLKRPSKVLKRFLLCVVRMAKKPLSVVRGIKKVMAFPSKKKCLGPRPGG
jgi:hypothetical protein